MTTAFVTGATGLLGNNLVRLLAKSGVAVKALVRSKEKAARQFAGLPVEAIEGDMTNVAAFARHLAGVDTIFHTAAEFRDSFKGGRHWEKLYAVNVVGTGKLLDAAYSAGVRRFVHTSSSGVIDGPVGVTKDETMLRREENTSNDYYRSKVQSDQIVLRFLDTHADFFAVFVLPGWMHGPGDAGPTSAGQVVLDFVRRKLPGIVPGTFSIVDARDVAKAEILAATKGRRGERYLVAGSYITMKDLFKALERITGIKAPQRNIAFPMLFGIAYVSELMAWIAGKPQLISLASVRLLKEENGKTIYDNSKAKRELGIDFRPIDTTLADEVAWYRGNGYLPNVMSSAGRNPMPV